jgi:formyltetrahydrofolate-dependent phosphoribosylglycinamide formyltransferase
VTRVRAAVLASGGGSNLQALLDHLGRLGERRALDVVVVAADRECGAMERAARAGIPASLLRSTRRPEAPALHDALAAHDVEMVVLAGFLRLVEPQVTRAFAGRMFNVHPGPLPRFGGPGMYGARVHRAVLAAGVAFSGPTVHAVDEIYDHGRVLAHWPVPVLAGDDEHSLAARVLRAEHLLYPRVMQAMARSIIQVRGFATGAGTAPPLVLPPFDPDLDDVTLAQQVDAVLP